MNAAKFRLAGYLALAAAAAVGAGYGWARSVHMPPIVEVVPVAIVMQADETIDADAESDEHKSGEKADEE